MRGKATEIFIVAGAVGQFDVERAGDLVKRVIPATVHAEREHGVVAGEDRVRSVALVHVEIDDHGTSHAACALERSNSDRYVVEDAETLTMIGERVVCSPGEIHRQSIFERLGGRYAGATD